MPVIFFIIVLLILITVGVWVFTVALPFVIWIVAIVLGFLFGVVMYTLSVALAVALCAGLGIASQYGLACLLRCVYQRHRLSPEIQVVIASAIGALLTAGAGVGMYAINSEREMLRQPNHPGPLQDSRFADDANPTYAEIFENSSEVGLYNAYGFGAVLGGLGGIWGVFFGFYKCGESAHELAVDTALNMKDPVSQRLLAEAADRLVAIDRDITALVTGLKITWPTHAGIIDPDQHDHMPPNAIRDLIAKKLAQPEQDLCELQAIEKQWMNARQLFAEAREELEITKAERHEIVKFVGKQRMIRESLVKHVEARDWKSANVTLVNVISAIKTSSIVSVLCADLEINDKADLTYNKLRKQYRACSLKYHPDINKSPSAAEKFQKIQQAYTRLTTYLDQKGILP